MCDWMVSLEKKKIKTIKRERYIDRGEGEKERKDHATEKILIKKKENKSREKQKK